MVSESNLQIPSLYAYAATRSPRWRTPIKEKWKNWNLGCAMLEDNNEITPIRVAFSYVAKHNYNRGKDNF
jgi:hypothetical protein